MEIIDKISALVLSVISFLMFYKVLFTVIGLLSKGKRFPKAKRDHSFGIVISARNERVVIGNLLDSINAQDYDPGLVKIFVVADNCTDDTADICRQKGAIVYERFDSEKARKGWALEYLFDCIDRDFGISSLDGYIVFDADNLLKPDFLKNINRAFDTDCDVAVGYRNTKNFSTNFISAGYGIHFFESSALQHRPRAVLGLSTHIAGTGYAIKSDVLKNGWHHHSLTEDTEFTLCKVSEGLKITFCEDAEFYDEQPYEIPIMMRQRLRWAKGRLVCFLRYGYKLLLGIFKRRGRDRLSCYDMFFYAFPKGLFSAVMSMLYPAAAFIAALIAGTAFSEGAGALPAVWNLLRSAAVSYLGFLFIGAAVAVKERKRIDCPTGKLILYVILFPWFDLTGLPISIISLFMRVKWKPIKHDKDIKIEDIAKTPAAK